MPAPHRSVFTDRMCILMPTQQCYSAERTKYNKEEKSDFSWLVSMLPVPFSVLSLFIVKQKGRPTNQTIDREAMQPTKTCATYHQKLFQKNSERSRLRCTSSSRCIRQGEQIHDIACTTKLCVNRKVKRQPDRLS